MDAVAKEKDAAMRRYRRLQTLGTLLRCLEAAGFLLFVYWSSLRLPAAARLSGDLFRRFALVLLSPRSVFFLGNAIVLLLLYKSGQLSPSKYTSNSSSSAGGSDDASAGAEDIYDEYFLEARERNHFYHHTASVAAATQTSAGDDEVKEKAVVYEDKPVRAETRRKQCRRSRSEKMHRQRKAEPELRRSETDVGGKGEKRPPLPEDEMDEEEVDDEEFRRTIEEFIAKQTKFRREESMAIVFADDTHGLSGSAGSPDRCTVK